MIIMLCSELPQQGKDLVANYLVEEYGFTKLAFADKLKEICYQIGWNGEKDEKGRQLLIDIAETSKKYNKTIWVKKVISKILKDKDKNYVISDLRFKVEQQELTELFENIFTIGIKSDVYGDNKFINSVSQIEFEHLHKDFIIENNGKIKDIKKDVRNIMERIGDK